jgi:hypothetical protein
LYPKSGQGGTKCEAQHADVEGTSLLRKHMGLNLYREFESLRLRQVLLCNQATAPDVDGEAWSCNPSAAMTFMMVANSGLPSAERALYRLSRPSPASRAI